jgi:hypothetical protein
MIPIDEQIASQKHLIKNHSGHGFDVDEAILASLEELKRIHESEMPVEPECVTRMRRLKDDPTWDVEWTTLRYIDTLQAVIKRKDAEEMKMAMLVNIADEKRLDAERERDALIAGIENAVKYLNARTPADVGLGVCIAQLNALIKPKQIDPNKWAFDRGLESF